MSENTLKQQILEAFPDAETDNHCSDLYVLFSPEINAWLKENYEFYSNVVLSHANVKGSDWYGKMFLDIPFAFTEYYTKRG